MNCKDFDELISAYANNELTGREREKIVDHLSGCARCGAELSEYVVVRSKLTSLQIVKDLPDVAGIVMSKIRLKKSPPVISKNTGLKGWPLWQIMVIGLVTLALVIVSAISLPAPLTGKSDVAAAEIALNSPDVKVIFGDMKGTKVAEVVDSQSTDGYKYVVLTRSRDLYVVAQVDKTTETVIQTWILRINDELKQDLKDIAGSDSRVQPLITGGAKFSDFTPSFWQGTRIITDSSGATIELGPVGFLALVTVEQGIHWYHVTVDLATREVVSVDPGALPVYYWYNAIFSILILLLIVAGIIILISLFSRAKLPSSGYLSIVSGIITFFTLIMYNPRNWIILDTSVILLPALGMVLGIVGSLKKSNPGRNVYNIIGIIICGLALASGICAVVWLSVNLSNLIIPL